MDFITSILLYNCALYGHPRQTKVLSRICSHRATLQHSQVASHRRSLLSHFFIECVHIGVIYHCHIKYFAYNSQSKQDIFLIKVDSFQSKPHSLNKCTSSISKQSPFTSKQRLSKKKSFFVSGKFSLGFFEVFQFTFLEQWKGA